MLCPHCVVYLLAILSKILALLSESMNFFHAEAQYRFGVASRREGGTSRVVQRVRGEGADLSGLGEDEAEFV